MCHIFIFHIPDSCGLHTFSSEHRIGNPNGKLPPEDLVWAYSWKWKEVQLREKNVKEGGRMGIQQRNSSWKFGKFGSLLSERNVNLEKHQSSAERGGGWKPRRPHQHPKPLPQLRMQTWGGARREPPSFPSVWASASCPTSRPDRDSSNYFPPQKHLWPSLPRTSEKGRKTEENLGVSLFLPGAQGKSWIQWPAFVCEATLSVLGAQEATEGPVVRDQPGQHNKTYVRVNKQTNSSRGGGAECL